MTALIRLSLPDPLRAFVDEQVARHGFGSAGEYLAALVARAMERDARGPGAGPIEPWIELGFRSREELEAELLKGLDSPASEMTAEDWTELRRRIIRRDSARADLEGLSEFLRQRNPRAALKFLRNAEATFDSWRACRA